MLFCIYAICKVCLYRQYHISLIHNVVCEHYCGRCVGKAKLADKAYTQTFWFWTCHSDPGRTCRDAMSAWNMSVSLLKHKIASWDVWSRNNQPVFLNAKQLHKKHPEGQTLKNPFYLRKQPSLLISLSSLILLVVEAETELDCCWKRDLKGSNRKKIRMLIFQWGQRVFSFSVTPFRFVCSIGL